MTQMPKTGPAAPGQVPPVKPDLGQVAYEAYALASGGVSLVSGQPLPGWGERAEDIRMAWRMSAGAVLITIDQYERVAAREAQPAPELGTAWRLLDEAREQLRLVREDRDGVRGRMLALAAALEDEAAASSYALESTPLAEAAARIRKGLDV